MKNIGKFTVQHLGQDVRVEVWCSKRQGSRSPLSLFYRYNDRWITSFERDRRGWSVSTMTELNMAMRFSYDTSLIAGLVYEENPFLLTLPKEYSWVGGYYEVPCTRPSLFTTIDGLD